MRYHHGMLALILLLSACVSEQQQPKEVPLPPAAQRGPAVDQPLPPFSLPDQDGHVRSFETLRGDKGLVLVLVQSADW